MQEEAKKTQEVRAFMRQVGARRPKRLPSMPYCLAADELLRRCGAEMHGMSQSAGVLFREVQKDQRLLRCKLMTEELGELLEALAAHDELGALDALADLMYVVIGTAVQFDLPVDAAFDEVHRSNMTKHASAAEHTGDKGKGDGYVPPDLLPILDGRDAP